MKLYATVCVDPSTKWECIPKWTNSAKLHWFSAALDSSAWPARRSARCVGPSPRLAAPAPLRPYWVRARPSDLAWHVLMSYDFIYHPKKWKATHHWNWTHLNTVLFTGTPARQKKSFSPTLPCLLPIQCRNQAQVENGKHLNEYSNIAVVHGCRMYSTTSSYTVCKSHCNLVGAVNPSEKYEFVS